MASHLTAKAKVPNRSNALPSACLCPGCIENTWPQARDSTVMGSPSSKLTLLRNHVSGQKNPSHDGPSSLSEQLLFCSSHSGPPVSHMRPSAPPVGVSAPWRLLKCSFLSETLLAALRKHCSPSSPLPGRPISLLRCSPQSLSPSNMQRIFLLIIPLPQLKCSLLRARSLPFFIRAVFPAAQIPGTY